MHACTPMTYHFWSGLCLSIGSFFVLQDWNGWDIMRALAVVKSEYKHDPVTIKAAIAIEKRVRLVRALAASYVCLMCSVRVLHLIRTTACHWQVGRDYFRIHPKGVGMMCVRSAGLPPLSFVSEYLGEMYSPARWCGTNDGLGSLWWVWLGAKHCVLI